MSSSSAIDRESSLHLQFLNLYSAIITETNEEDEGYESLTIDFLTRLAIYVAVLVVGVLVVALIVRLLGNLNGEANPEQVRVTVRVTETNRLLSKEATSFTYGSCDEYSESGNCSSSSSSSSEDLYDGKICVICYDEQRNCFFIPCGHCATCCVCAQRIMEEENKMCPVCRRQIRKVRRLFVS